MQKICALNLNWINCYVKRSFPELQIPGSRPGRIKMPPCLLFSGPGQHLLHVCNDVRHNGPKSSSDVHLLWIDGSHGVPVRVVEVEIFI